MGHEHFLNSTGRHEHFLNSTGRHDHFLNSTGRHWAFLNSTCKNGTPPVKGPSIPTPTYMEEECNNSCTLISRLRSMQGTQQQQLTILQQIGARLKIDNLGGALETSSVMMNPDQLSMYDNMTLGPPPSPMMARMGSTKGVEPSTSTATVELT